MAAFERVRHRIHAPKNSGSHFLGKLRPWNVNINNWHPTFTQTWNYNYNLPWTEAAIVGDELHKGPPYKEGGPFKSLKLDRMSPYEIQGVGTYNRQSDVNPANWQQYVGGFAPPDVPTLGGVDISNLSSILVPDSSLFPDTLGYGSRAWSSTKPRLERASLFVFLAELRDLPRMLQATAEAFHIAWTALGGSTIDGIMQPKKLADQFLNEEFGWAPFLGDLRRLYKVFNGQDALIKHLSSINGKPSRREATLVDTRSIVKVAGGSAQVIEPVLNSNFFSATPTWEVHEETKVKVHASGKFSFYRPEFDMGLNDYSSPWYAIQRQLTTYGLRISPSNIYRATPWTWLIDWFSNVGSYFDLIGDIAIDSVICHYLFITQAKTTTRRFRQVLPFKSAPWTIMLEWNKIIDSKERVGNSSPYGFSLSWDNLTLRQLALLGALGITRRR